MSNRGWTFKKHVLLSFSMTMIVVLSHYTFLLIGVLMVRFKFAGFLSSYQAASLAIIGGSDGPTAIYSSYLSNAATFEYIFFFIILILLYGPIKKALNNAFRA